MRCGWDDVILWLKLTLCWDHEIHIHMIFWCVVCKNSRCWNVLHVLLCLSMMSIWMMNLWYCNLLSYWDWRMNLWWCMIIVDDNLVLKIIHMCEKELTISFGKILLLLEDGILGRVSCMIELHLIKVTWGSHLIGHLPEYHPYVLTSNDISKCWELLLRRISDPFSVCGMDCCWWWNLDPWDKPWVGWWVWFLLPQTSRNLSLVVVCE